MTTTTMPGAVVVFTDVDPEHEDEFNQWYQEQHLGERLGVPGFRSARRLESVVGGIKYLAFYETDSVATLASPQYREQLNNPTAWTQRTMPWFRNMTRSCCNVTIDVGTGLSGCVIACAFTPASESADELRRWLREEWCVKLKAERDVLRVRLCETDKALTGVPNREVALRGGQDQAAGWTLMIDVVGESAAARLLQHALLHTISAESCLKITIAPTQYRLLCYLHKSQ
jgi:hypothetical protein